MGKTRLAEEVAAGSGGLRSAGPRRAPGRRDAVRPDRRGAALLPASANPDVPGLACGPRCSHLALILPELGERASEVSDRATLFEAVRSAFAYLAREATCPRRARRPAVVRRGHPRAARPPRWPSREPAAAYAPDCGVPLRRAPARPHVAAAPARAAPRAVGSSTKSRCRFSSSAETAELLGEEEAPRSLRRHRSSTRSTTAPRGLPFFVEELARALLLIEIGDLAGRRGLELSEGARRGAGTRHGQGRGADRRLGALSVEARASADAAAVAGEAFDLELVGQIAGAAGVAELWLERWPASRRRVPVAARFATLWPERLYTRTSRGWSAGRCTAGWRRGSRPAAGPSMEVATHWLGAREVSHAREALLHAAEESRTLPRIPRRRLGPAARRSSSGPRGRSPGAAPLEHPESLRDQRRALGGACGGRTGVAGDLGYPRRARRSRLELARGPAQAGRRSTT